MKIIKPIIAPSISACNFAEIKKGLKLIERSKVQWIHFDVMDGIFVPNLTFGPKFIAELRPLSKKYFDVHLMLVQPEKFLKAFAEAGANGLTIHCEIDYPPEKIISEIKSLGLKAGISFRPQTEVKRLMPFLEIVDLVLVMTVNPGFSGQKMIPECVKKVKELAELKEKRGYNYYVEVDGGINLHNFKQVLEAGGEILVMGNGFFKAEKPLEVVNSINKYEYLKNKEEGL